MYVTFLAMGKQARFSVGGKKIMSQVNVHELHCIARKYYKWSKNLSGPRFVEEYIWGNFNS